MISRCDSDLESLFQTAGIAGQVMARNLKFLPEKILHRLFVLNGVFLGTSERSGPFFHSLLIRWLQAESAREEDLLQWIREQVPQLRISKRSLDQARKFSDRLVAEGCWAAIFEMCSNEVEQSRCPNVLFGLGRIPSELIWAAIFNSRKPRNVSPSETWLEALRSILWRIREQGAGLVTSVGTLTYDLTTLYAQNERMPLITVIPFPLSHLDQSPHPLLGRSNRLGSIFLTCHGEGAICPKTSRMICRDRLLAALSDIHCLLEIRQGGNLSKILNAQQRIERRLQIHLREPDRSISTITSLGKDPLGNSRRNQRFSHMGVHSLSPGQQAGSGVDSIPREKVRWGDYLYHYTRSCPGPWPGQSYRDFLNRLVVGEPTAGHRAIDTLGRILAEGLIRGSSRLIRGGFPVISWSARSPLELNILRRWNPALIRWTFTPHGIAARREDLKKLGAKPVIYAREEILRRLPVSEHFRFQLHRSPGCNWKHEREWRMKGDLDLMALHRANCFVFVPSEIEAEWLRQQGRSILPVVVLDIFPG